MRRRGNVVLSLLFMMLLAASGLAWLARAGLHFRIVAARCARRIEGSALEQALVLGLHRYRARLAAADMRAFQAPELDFFNNDLFPDQVRGGISLGQRFSCRTLRTGGGFTVVRVLNQVRAGRPEGGRAYVGRAGVDLVAGDVPAGEFGLVVRRGSEVPVEEFLAERGVEYPGTQLPLVREVDARVDGEQLLAAALRLSVPGWRGIREKFGLEPSDAPIPTGIYLVADRGEVPAVFVQGDLQKLEFGAAWEWQRVSFTQNGRSLALRYQPGLPSLAWSGDEGPAVAGCVFAEKIFVHGSVWGVEQAGEAAFLPAARIELLVNGRLAVRSGLAGENLKLGREKIPCLLLMTCGRDLLGNEAVNADVVIEGGGDKVLQAQVVAAGTLVNGDGRTEITGGLFATNIENPGSLRVGGVPGEFGLDDHVRLDNFKFLRNFRVHFIAEAGDGE